MIIVKCRIKQPTGLSFLREIASNHTAYDILLIIDCKSTYYVENLTRLNEAVCRQRTVADGYMDLCVDRDLNCG